MTSSITSTARHIQKRVWFYQRMAFAAFLATYRAATMPPDPKSPARACRTLERRTVLAMACLTHAWPELLASAARSAMRCTSCIPRKARPSVSSKSRGIEDPCAAPAPASATRSRAMLRGTSERGGPAAGTGTPSRRASRARMPGGRHPMSLAVAARPPLRTNAGCEASRGPASPPLLASAGRRSCHSNACRRYGAYSSLSLPKLPRTMRDTLRLSSAMPTRMSPR